MPGLMPPELLPVVAALALVVAWPRVRAWSSCDILFVEVFGIALVTIGLVAVAWAALWWVAQRR